MGGLTACNRVRKEGRRLRRDELHAGENGGGMRLREEDGCGEDEAVAAVGFDLAAGRRRVPWKLVDRPILIGRWEKGESGLAWWLG